MISVGEGEGEGGRVNISSSLRMGKRCNIISRGERGLGSGGIWEEIDGVVNYLI